MADEDLAVPFISYHLRVLASKKVKAIRQVKRRQVRGAEEKFFYLRNGSVAA